MDEYFLENRFKLEDGHIFYKVGGSGPPLLLLHGYPQNHMMWLKIAPMLANKYTIVLPDLRGYGKSLAPTGDANHENYSKRVMADDLKQLMSHLNFDKFGLIGHDRGGRVAHRMAKDNRGDISGLIVMDICPTLDMYESTNMDFAKSYFHWFFLIQPVGIPETLINKNPEFWLNNCLKNWSDGYDFGEVKAGYIEHFRKPENIHGSCEDYRASASIDLEHDKEDRHHKLEIPIYALWGSRGFIGQTFDPVSIWQKYTTNFVWGKSLECGHFLPEEKTDETAAEIVKFFNYINYN